MEYFLLIIRILFPLFVMIGVPLIIAFIIIQNKKKTDVPNNNYNNRLEPISLDGSIENTVQLSNPNSKSTQPKKHNTTPVAVGLIFCLVIFIFGLAYYLIKGIDLFFAVFIIRLLIDAAIAFVILLVIYIILLNLNKKM